MDGVFLGTYAVKVAPVGDNRLWLRKVLVEVNNLQSLNHRNVVRYMHSWLEDYSNSPFSPMVPCLFILMEYANAGNLHTRLGLDLAQKARPIQSEETVRDPSALLVPQYSHPLLRVPLHGRSFAFPEERCAGRAAAKRPLYMAYPKMCHVSCSTQLETSSGVELLRRHHLRGSLLARHGAGS